MKTDDSAFGAEPIWGFLLTAIYIIGMPYVFYWPLRGMVDDVRLHFTGTEAKESACRIYSYHGTRSSTWHVYVSYTAQDGTEHSPDVDTFMWWRQPDDAKPCTVRYDPASPDHVSTDWGLGRLFGRVLGYLILLPIPLFGEVAALGLMLAFLTRSARSLSPQMPEDWQASATTTSWHGYCGALIRRRNRRLFIMSVFLLSIGSVMFWAHPSGIWYWRGFFLGPQPVTGADLDSSGFSPRRAGWISVAAPRLTDTGVEIYRTFSDRRKFLEGHYALAQIDGHPLLMHVDSLRATSPYQGTLQRIENPLKTLLKAKGYTPEKGANASATAPYYLETVDQDSLVHYRQVGIDDFEAGALFLLFGFPALWLSLRRSIDNGRHPFARALAKRGSLAADVQQIDLEMAGGVRTFARLHITSHWLIAEKYWSPVAIRASDVTKAYSMNDKTGPACCIHDRWGDKLQSGMKSKKMADQAAAIIATMAPQAARV